jgi:SAM-dependent methyltransferase
MLSNKPDEIFFDPAIYESQFAYATQFTDVPFWIRLAKTLGPKVLELACGTGRITIPTFESGVDIDGVDFSELMLNVARDRAKARSLPVNFFWGDIRSLSLQRQYDLMFLPTGTISHLISRPELEAFLEGVRKTLRPTGVLALDLHNLMKTFLSSWPLNPGPEHSSFQLQTTKETVQLTTTRSYQPDTQLFSVKFRYTFANGSTRDAAIVLRLFFPPELQMLLYYNGFEVSEIYGDYTQSEFKSEHSKYVVIARKRQ